MEPLILASTKTTPAVSFDPGSQMFRVIGNSTPVDALEFYNKLTDWLKANEGAISDDAIFRFCLPYFNSASHKGIFLLLKQISLLRDNSKKLQIVWGVESDDEFMREAGETMQELLDLRLNFEEIA